MMKRVRTIHARFAISLLLGNDITTVPINRGGEDGWIWLTSRGAGYFLPSVPDKPKCVQCIDPLLGQLAVPVLISAIADPATELVAVLQFVSLGHSYMTMFGLVLCQAAESFLEIMFLLIPNESELLECVDPVLG